MEEFKIQIDDISENETQKYAPIFKCVGELFGDYIGIYFKLLVDEQEYILQRRDNSFILYTVNGEDEVSYEMFSIDEEYKVDYAVLEDFKMYTVSGDKVIKRWESNNIETLIFKKRSDGTDLDGYDGTIGYVQYNQENDVRLMLLFQQMYNEQEKVYGYHVGKDPFQILVEKGAGAKERGSILPVIKHRYIRTDFDERTHPYLYNIAVIKDYGLAEFMEKGAYALQKSEQIVRYYKVLFQTKDRIAITAFPFGIQHKYEDFSDLFNKYGFCSEVPYDLIELHNGNNRDLRKYEAIAAFMKEIEMTPPDHVIELKLKFERSEENGTNS